MLLLKRVAVSSLKGVGPLEGVGIGIFKWVGFGNQRAWILQKLASQSSVPFYGLYAGLAHHKIVVEGPCGNDNDNNANEDSSGH